MRTDVVYEVIDSRKVAMPLERLGVVSLGPGGMTVLGLSGMATDLDWDDDDPEGFVDDENSGTVNLLTKDGWVAFQAVGFDNWEDNLAPFWTGYIPDDIRTDKQLNEFLYRNF